MFRADRARSAVILVPGFHPPETSVAPGGLHAVSQVFVCGVFTVAWLSLIAPAVLLAKDVQPPPAQPAPIVRSITIAGSERDLHAGYPGFTRRQSG